MPDNDNNEGGKGKSDDGGMMSTRGWVIVISVVVLEALFFIVLIWFLSRRAPSDRPETAVQRVTVEDIVRRSLVLEQLNYSKLSPGGTMQTLVMDLNIQMAPTEREREEGIRLSEEDWTLVMQAVEKLKPEILNELVTYIDKQPISTLASPRGKEQIQNHVREFVNTRLRGVDLGLRTKNADSERVTRVLITRFFIQ